MQLSPKRPPGRADRKAAAFASEIARLRDAGYTYEAIREALAEVGIELSTSALRREVHRLCLQTARIAPPPQPDPSLTNAMPPPALPLSPGAPPDASSRELAEAFFNAHPANPLLRSKDIR